MEVQIRLDFTVSHVAVHCCVHTLLKGDCMAQEAEEEQGNDRVTIS